MSGPGVWVSESHPESCKLCYYCHVNPAHASDMIDASEWHFVPPPKCIKYSQHCPGFCHSIKPTRIIATHTNKKKVCNQQHPLLALHILTPECTASTNLSRVEASGWRGNGNRPFVLSSFSCLLVDLFCIAYRSFYTPLTRIFGEKQHISLIYACYDSFK